jgi:hypothetical protein
MNWIYGSADAPEGIPLWVEASTLNSYSPYVGWAFFVHYDGWRAAGIQSDDSRLLVNRWAVPEA